MFSIKQDIFLWKHYNIRSINYIYFDSLCAIFTGGNSSEGGAIFPGEIYWETIHRWKIYLGVIFPRGSFSGRRIAVGKLSFWKWCVSFCYIPEIDISVWFLWSQSLLIGLKLIKKQKSWFVPLKVIFSKTEWKKIQYNWTYVIL